MNSAVILEKFESQKRTHLFISVFLDLLGMFTYALPILGELGDLIFAPFYALAIIIIYRKRIFSALSGGVFGFFEEILPMTDFFPTATIMWTYTYVMRKESTLNSFLKDTHKSIDMVNRSFENRKNLRY